MKKLLPKLFTVLIIGIASNSFVRAQTLTVVPNPDTGLGWQGGVIAYNGNMYFTYKNAAGRDLLGIYNGDSIVTIPNPTNTELAAPLIVANDTLYLEYYNFTLGVYQIASYDGTNITLIANPDNTQQPFFSVGTYNNKLIFEYASNSSSEIAEWAGGKWKMFAIPSPGGFTYNTPFTQYKNNIYAGYQTQPPANLRQLLQFNDTVVTLVPNPDGATAFSPFSGGFQSNLVVYGNNLYFRYVNIGGSLQLAQYNGDSVKLIPNPTGGIGYVLASVASPVIYDSALYIPYCSGANIAAGIQLAKFDGKNLTLVSNPDAGSGYQGAGIVYDSSLYFQYLDGSNVYRLAKYNDTTITLITNPQPFPSGYANYTSTGASITPPVVYSRQFNVVNNGSGSLYIQYENLNNINQLGQYTNGGDSVKLIANPDTATFAQTGYRGSPFIYNNLLYINYSTAKQTYNFAYFNDLGSLPVSLLNFTAQQKGIEGNLLQWQTASESNTAYFSIQRSSTGRMFTNVGKIAAAGNSNGLLNYNFVDAINDANYAPAVYYRLQEVDKDGRTTYSKIAIIRVDNNGGFSITPNPVSGNIVLSSAFNVAGAELVLHDMNGKNLYNAKMGLIAGSKVYIPAASLANGLYILTITANNITYQLKVVKGVK